MEKEGISQQTIDEVIDTLESIRAHIDRAEHALRQVITVLTVLDEGDQS